jgi:hypothetical protein
MDEKEATMKKTSATIIALAVLAMPLSGVSLARDKGDPGNKPFPQKNKSFRGDKKPRRGEMDDRRKVIMTKELIEREYPDKVEELKKLREENPEKFREEVKNLLKKIKEKKGKERKAFMELLKQYRENPSDNLKKRIMDNLSAQFDERLTMMRKIVDKRMELAEKMKERLEKRVENKNRIVEERFKELTKDPNLRW